MKSSSAVRPQRKRLGDLLVESGRLTESQVQEALRQQTPTRRLGRVLQDMDLISEQEIMELLGKQLHMPCMKKDQFLIDPEIVEIIPESIARRHNVIPLFVLENELTVAISDPFDLVAIDTIRKDLNYRISTVLATESAIADALDQYYSVAQSIRDVIDSYEGKTEVSSEEAPAIRLVNQILFQAIQVAASDIHIEPSKEACRVRFRIDGILNDIFAPPKDMGLLLVARLKILAHLDISEKRLPQDGRFSIKVGKREIDVRLSTLPTIHGEKVVLRILDKSSFNIGLEHLGLDSQDEETIRSLLSRPYGMLLVTGPTGSGKTTTLYSMIKHLNREDKNIITIEDPVEYELAGINQVQANSRINLTFQTALRSILRQDPDIILIGEIRDEETAAIAVRAALTGHFVLSTLHTNDALSSIGRLLDMNIHPYLLSSSLIGVIAQRLIRTVCKDCVRMRPPTEDECLSLGINPADQSIQVPEPVGCKRCNQTGFKGRTAIMDVLTIDSALRQMITESKSSSGLEQHSSTPQGYPLRDAGLRKVLQGVTTLQEVNRVLAMVEG